MHTSGALSFLAFGIYEILFLQNKLNTIPYILLQRVELKNPI